MARYTDVPSIVQVIGNIYNDNSLLDKEEYSFNTEDFPDEFHRIVFGSIFNLHSMGVEKVTPMSIEDYLQERPEKLAKYRSGGGEQYLKKISESAERTTFPYYYSRMKKMTLLRMYHQMTGMDLSSIYDDTNILDVKKKQIQEDYLDNATVQEIAERIDVKIRAIREKFAEELEGDEISSMGDDILEMLEERRKHPDVGVPLYGDLYNTVTRGARLTKFYLRSAPVNTGKTRTMIADACIIGCDEVYDVRLGKWVKTSPAQPTMYIATEQERAEVQMMCLAFLTGIPESRISLNECDEEEWQRIEYAADLLKGGKLFFTEKMDFSLSEMENIVKKSVKDFDVAYIFLDYIHSSIKILSEITSSTGIKGMREDNILFMLSAKLKEICLREKVFIMSATQLNGDYKTAKKYDQNLLRGAKAIADWAA